MENNEHNDSNMIKELLREIMQMREQIAVVAKNGASGSNVMPVITIGELITQAIQFKEQYDIGKPSTQKTYKTRLLTNVKGLGTTENLFNSLGVYTTKDINETNIFNLYKIYREKVSSTAYLSGIMCALRNVLEWGMQRKYLDDNKFLLTLCKQKMPAKHNIQTPTNEELECLGRFPLGKNKLVVVQMYFIIAVLMIRLGLRSAKEIINIDVDDVDIKNRTLHVHRKDGSYQPVEFARDLVPLFRYMRLIRYHHLKSHDAADTEPFIIKFDNRIKGRGTSNDWRLKPEGLLQRWRYTRRKLGLPEARKLYHFRKLSVSVQAKVARVLGIAVEDVAFRNNHSRTVFNRHYNALINDTSEYLCRDMAENVTFIKERIEECKEHLINNPNDIACQASYWQWFEKLGKIQNEIDMDEYRGKVSNRTSFGFSQNITGLRNVLGTSATTINNESEVVPSPEITLPFIDILDEPVPEIVVPRLEYVDAPEPMNVLQFRNSVDNNDNGEPLVA